MVLQENPSSFSFSPLKPAFFHLTPFTFFSSFLNSVLLFSLTEDPPLQTHSTGRLQPRRRRAHQRPNPGPRPSSRPALPLGAPRPLSLLLAAGALWPPDEPELGGRRTAAPAPSWPKLQGRGEHLPLPKPIPAYTRASGPPEHRAPRRPRRPRPPTAARACSGHLRP